MSDLAAMIQASLNNLDQEREDNKPFTAKAREFRADPDYQIRAALNPAPSKEPPQFVPIPATLEGLFMLGAAWRHWLSTQPPYPEVTPHV